MEKTLEQLSAEIRAGLERAQGLLQEGPRVYAQVRLPGFGYLFWISDRGSWYLGIGDNRYFPPTPVLSDKVTDEGRAAAAGAIGDLAKDIAVSSIKLHELSTAGVAALNKFLEGR